mmetsp:Transcript_2871/g.10077  ORF Transcript_2871/g.10077 Transcript_2871/m.10077 type:complete len:85 (-) Transcript_2871:100-354(-)|eukprot:CAMPEP_0114612560 /NCGR_PEP_ID=MMETSP0168-20121206/4684_1 /TAXON_ID=95228 ORGANISM="Vannella sp., Strain DIVA3 517/6/12" /NCGR_SAMPLE_ID=MMETSP0168 /ASSEMBLY_ACC=CAM_ASM_000044 /LENGTH=84 /DNA_ID=CAMNT_0001823547 /DNA_START=27 /DNA_END=281 /DNA_ORIENTATION=+
MSMARIATRAVSFGRTAPQYYARRYSHGGPLTKESMTSFGPEAFEPVPKEGFFLAAAASACVVLSWGLIARTKSHVAHHHSSEH